MWFRALLLTLIACAAEAAPLRLVALGDMPYGDPAVVYPPYQALIARVNEAPPALVIHVGDTKSGSSPCSDRVLAEQRAFMMQFAAPVLYTPGDNEWTDCHRGKAGNFDPFERLRRIREIYFAEPVTLGRPLPLIRDKRPEQARLMLEGVMVMSVHVTGSENGRGLVPFDRRETFEARTAGAIAWLEAGFAAATAQEASAVVVALHADMFGDDDFKRKKQTWRKASAFRAIGEALTAQAAAYRKPVLLIFGDSHQYRVFQPLTDEAPNLVAMEVYGAPDMDTVEVLVEPGARQPFRFARIAGPLRP